MISRPGVIFMILHWGNPTNFATRMSLKSPEAIGFSKRNNFDTRSKELWIIQWKIHWIIHNSRSSIAQPHCLCLTCMFIIFPSSPTCFLNGTWNHSSLKKLCQSHELQKSLFYIKKLNCNNGMTCEWTICIKLRVIDIHFHRDTHLKNIQQNAEIIWMWDIYCSNSFIM